MGRVPLPQVCITESERNLTLPLGSLPVILCIAQTPGPGKGFSLELPRLMGISWGKTVPLLCRANPGAKLHS